MQKLVSAFDSNLFSPGFVLYFIFNVRNGMDGYIRKVGVDRLYAASIDPSTGMTPPYTQQWTVDPAIHTSPNHPVPFQ